MKCFNDCIQNGKNLNTKKIVLTIVVILLIIAIAIFSAMYISNEYVRNFFDQYLFRKNITQENLPTIEINSGNIGEIFVYDKYIALLDKNILKTYSAYGKKEFEFDVNISQPISDNKNRFLCIAEKSGQKIYLISGQNILWQKDIEGEIDRINVNKNGYVSVVVSGTGYKTIVITFNPEGKELFKTYLSTTTSVAVDISNDNRYLAIAEVNATGSMVQSNIKVISVDKAQSDPTNAIEYMYSANPNELITNIRYQDKNKLICMYDDSIHMIQNNSDEKLIDLSEKKDIFADIKLKDNVIKISEKASGLFSEVQAQITNINTRKEKIYSVTGVPKTIMVYENVIAINLGTEIHFIDCNGWLIKKYTSHQEIKDIVIGSNIAVIVYKDKIEIINL